MKNSNRSHPVKLNHLAEEVGAELHGDGAVEISGAAPIETAVAGDITFVANPNYYKHLDTTSASAVVLDRQSSFDRLPSLRHEKPYLIFARIIDILYPDATEQESGCHTTAVTDQGASVDPSAHVGPFCHIESGSTIGKNCRLVSSVYVGCDVVIGDNCIINPGVVIMDDCRIGSNVIIHASTVIGSDGFGFAESETGLKKIKQIGWVEIADDVEIGSNVSIDRGALGPTRVGRGTKIDNLVQIAHNVDIGEHCLIVAQVGISGSTKICDQVVLAGQVGMVGHIEIGRGAKVGAQSGVSKSIPAGMTVLGTPAREIKSARRIMAVQPRLPDLLKRIGRLEEKSTDQPD